MIRRNVCSLLVATFALVSATVFAAPKTGAKAPEFSLTDLDNKTHKLSDFKGKYVVLEWFNAECPFVVKHYKSGNMQKLQETYTAAGKDVVWLTINSSRKGAEGHFKDAASAKATISEWKGKMTAVLVDEAGTVGKLYGAKTTPHMFVIDPKGVVLYQGAIDDKPSAEIADITGAKNFVSAALDEAMSGKKVAKASTTPYGCSVKY